MKACKFCGSRCIDVRGNCGACGAPLDDDTYYSFPPISHYAFQSFDKTVCIAVTSTAAFTDISIPTYSQWGV